MIGRDKEKKRLDQCVESKEAQLVVVYGRRRVGKTFLINEYFNGRFDFKITGVHHQNTEFQLRSFIGELNNQTGGKHTTPRDWMEAFSLLREYLETKSTSEKTVVFLDEMPWLDTAKSSFLPAFEWFWNGWGSARKNLICIVCGSATSWMKKNIDENRGGLYNRLTCRIYLSPFTLRETETYLRAKKIEWSRYDIIQVYMIMGGIPYYLSLLQSDLSLNQNIDNIFFRKRAELWDEFTYLYAALFQNSEQIVRIVETLCKKRCGLSRNEIIRETGLPDNGNVTRMLEDLEYSGFVRINDFYGNKKKYYQLSDYYSMFYFRYIKDNYGKDEHFWSNTIDNPAKRAWAGLTFEQICKDHIPQIKNKLGISGVLSTSSVWSRKGNEEESGAEIDLIIDRRDRVINLCEIKFSVDEYEIDKDYDLKLRNKVGTFVRATGTKNTIQLTMITTYGIRNNKYSSVITNQVTLEDLFE